MHKLIILVLVSFIYYSCTSSAAKYPMVDVRCQPYTSYLENDPHYGCVLNKNDVPRQVDEFTVFNFVESKNWNYALVLQVNTQSKVTIFPFGMFTRFVFLEKLEWKGGLKIIHPLSFNNANKLKSLELSYNDLTMLPTNVFQLALNLEEVSMDLSKIQKIEDYAFSGLDKLRRISLGWNPLKIIKKNAFANIESLQYLFLRECQIHTIEKDAFNLPNLRYISLSDNKLETIPSNLFAQTPKLEEIIFFNNKFTSIGDAFANLKRLRRLDLSYNRIDDIDLNSLARLPELIDLNLVDTGFKLYSFECSVENPQLAYLNIGSNKLSESDVFYRMKCFKKLQNLTLNFNNFTKFDDIDKVSRYLPQLRFISSSRNPIPCNVYEWYECKLNKSGVILTGSCDL